MLSHRNMKPGQTLYHLTWEDKRLHIHEVLPAKESQGERETRAALQTLQALAGDYRCLYCDQRLYWSGTVCYSCEHTFFCPICDIFSYRADEMQNLREQCSHLLTPVESWITPFFLQAPVVQKSHFYPHWSTEQIYQAYGPETAVYVRHLFQHDLRRFDPCRFQDLVLRLYIQPDFKVHIRDYEFYFCHDIAGALRRIRGFHDALVAGTEHLRTMQPVHMVRDWTA